MNVVVDTNIFVSSFFGGHPRKIIDRWKEGRITLCLTREIINEYTSVLVRLGLTDESFPNFFTFLQQARAFALPRKHHH
jgi:predicted nucleic acid-binding protein